MFTQFSYFLKNSSDIRGYLAEIQVNDIPPRTMPRNKKNKEWTSTDFTTKFRPPRQTLWIIIEPSSYDALAGKRAANVLGSSLVVLISHVELWVLKMT